MIEELRLVRTVHVQTSTELCTRRQAISFVDWIDVSIRGYQKQ